jgi:hypothetical protein
VDVVHHVLAREHRTLRQSAATWAVHRQYGQDDVEAEVVVQMPRAEYSEIDGCPTHLRAVHANEPRAVLAVAQYEGVFGVVG